MRKQIKLGIVIEGIKSWTWLFSLLFSTFFFFFFSFFFIGRDEFHSRDWEAEEFI